MRNLKLEIPTGTGLALNLPRLMGRLLAVDFGMKRTGLAVTDELRLIAEPLDTVETYHVMDYLKKYVDRESVDTIIVGLPKQMNGADSEIGGNATAFAKALSQEFPSISIERQDERFTSMLAERSILQGGASKKKRQDKALVDRTSAAIILQGYMDRINRQL